MTRPNVRRTIRFVAAAALAAAVLGPVAGRSLLAPPQPAPPAAAGPGEASTPAPPTGGRWDEAERFRAEGSHARALAILVEIDAGALSDDDRRWLRFRIADSTWRSLAATPQPDDTASAEAVATLELLASGPPFDRVRAEAAESLGDVHWMRRGSNRFDLAWPRYREALDAWAASRAIDLARARYLAIVRKASRHGDVPAWWRGGWRPDLPADVVENAARIARDPEDVAWTRYRLALALRGDVSTPARYDRAADAFDEAIRAAAGFEWLDDALWEAAQLRLSPGRPVPDEGGGLAWQPDYEGAVRLLTDLLERFAEGESRHVRPARQTLADIVEPSVGVHVGEAYLPGSDVDVPVTWRNVLRVDLALYAVDPLRDLEPEADGSTAIEDAVDLDGRPALLSWTIESPESDDHVPRRDTLRIDRALDPGTYVLEARAGDARARALLPVTRTAAVLWSDEDRVAVHVADALDGTPRAGADVALWEGRSAEGRWTWSVRRAATDADGLARFPLASGGRSSRLLAVAGGSGGHAVATTWASTRAETRGSWTIHVFPDRPAYRPGETVRFKAIARIRDGGGGLATPTGRSLDYRLVDPRGAEIGRGTLSFNAFGGASAEHVLPDGVALGDARVELTDPAGSGRAVGNEILFGVEEYRLPEFRVDVRAAGSDAGPPPTVRPGETIEAEIEATYYFGGPVAGATAEIVVRRAPRAVRWHAPRPVPWIVEDVVPPPFPYGPAQEILRTTAVLDADGRARVSVPTSMTEDADWTVTVEARVRDASRREVAGSGSFQVTRQAYLVALEPDHRLLRPGDRARVAIRAIDGNERPVEGDGRLRVTREVWCEEWIDPWGRPVEGDALREAKRRFETFPPPPPDPGGPEWRLRFRGYRAEEIEDVPISLAPDGTAEWSFVPDRDGFYRLAWSSEPDDLWPVRAETTVWATTAETRTLGYRPGGLEIVVDRDAFRVGEEAVAMIVSPVPDAYVLFAIEPGGVDSLRVLRLRGDTALLRIPLDAGHAPNVWLHAASVRDASLAVDRRSVPVAAADRAFDVEVDLAGEEHRPGAEGRVRVRAIDGDGEPVEAEIALAVYDEAVEAIRPDRAGDPRTEFLSGARASSIQRTSSFAWRRYVRRTREADETEGIETGFEPATDGPVLAGAAQAEKAARSEFVSDLAAPSPAETEALGTVTVRSDFRATAAWLPSIVTGPDGTAEATFRWPESLTSWKAVARAAGRDARFGYGIADARTTKPLTVRLQTPRFLVAGDRAVVSAVLNNRTDRRLDVTVDLQATGLDAGGRGARTTSIEAGGESRVDWSVDATTAGAASFTVRAAATDDPEAEDGMTRTMPVVEHGLPILLAQSGRVRGDETTARFDLPSARRPGSTTLSVAVAPSIAVAALDALPYLLDYPYGCTEQTLSRFVPAVIVRRTLTRLGLDPADVERRMFGGIEPEHAPAVQGDREPSLDRLDAIVRAGLLRLADFQHADGGWGWWKPGDSDPFLTAYALWGLSEAAGAGVDVDRGSLRRAADHLDRRLVEAEDDPDLAAWMLHALAAEAEVAGRTDLAGPRLVAFERVFERRDALGTYGKALLALAAHRLGREDEASVLVRNLEDGVVRRDGSFPTAHWGAEGLGWRWNDGPVETTAMALRALLAIRPDHPLVEPAVAWLVENRRGAQWRHTRETAIAVLALSDRLAARGLEAERGAYRVEVNGVPVGEGRAGAASVLDAPVRIDVDPAVLRDGANRVRIARTGGEGPLYFAVEARYFSLEEPIPPASHRVSVEREYLVRRPYPTLLAGTRFDLVPLPDEGTVESGARIEVVLTIEVANDFEYLVFEDAKPAGLEAVDLRSGGDVVVRRLGEAAASKPAVERDESDYSGESRPVWRELRDRKIATFVDRLPQGFWEMRYELRTETPGAFHGLPVLGRAMYAPELRGNGAEHRVTVDER